VYIRPYLYLLEDSFSGFLRWRWR